MFISPMLLEQIEKPFSDEAYVFEPKIDGHRLILSREGPETRLFTRHRNECTRQYPELFNLPIHGDAVLDGELCCTDPETGNIDFELAMTRFQLKKKDRITSFAAQRPVSFVVWDILFHDGRDLRKLPLMKRRSILESVVQPNQYISIVPQVEGRGEELWKVVKARSLEGMVAKRKNSLYVSKRSREWLKIINYQYAEVFISGYRKDEYGWLVQVEENGINRSAGIIELGGGPVQRKAFYQVSKQLITGEDKNFVYLQPEIKAKVKFRNWTRNGMLRTPVFVDFIFSASSIS